MHTVKCFAKRKCTFIFVQKKKFSILATLLLCRSALCCACMSICEHTRSFHECVCVYIECNCADAVCTEPITTTTSTPKHFAWGLRDVCYATAKKRAGIRNTIQQRNATHQCGIDGVPLCSFIRRFLFLLVLPHSPNDVNTLWWHLELQTLSAVIEFIYLFHNRTQFGSIEFSKLCFHSVFHENWTFCNIWSVFLR